MISRSAEYLQMSLKLVEDILGACNVQVNAEMKNQVYSVLTGHTESLNAWKGGDSLSR